MQTQLEHHNTHFKKRTHPIILLCDSMSSPANTGSLFRIADSFGVEKLIFGNVDIDLSSPRLKKTARSTQNWIPMEKGAAIAERLEELIAEEYIPIALEITNRSIPISECVLSENSKIALVIGDENTGVSEIILKKCVQHIHITMFGKNSSMNVTQAAAIALYEITKQL